MDEESFNKYSHVKAIKDFSEKVRLKRNRVGFVKMWVGKVRDDWLYQLFSHWKDFLHGLSCSS